MPVSGSDEILNSGSPKGDSGSRNIPLDEEKLMAYLAGDLSPEQQYELEHFLNEEGMESDAVDGLKMLETEEVRSSVNRLNSQLGKAIGTKKRSRRKPGSNSVTLISVVIILLLAVVAYFVVRLMTVPHV